MNANERIRSFRPEELTLFIQEKKKFNLVDFAVPMESSWKMKASEKMDEFLDFSQ